MALQARHRYIVSRINEAFKLDDEEMIEELIRKENFISRINAFFRANGPTRIFIFCEKLGSNRRSTPEDAAALQKKTCSHNDDVALYYSDGSDLESLPSSAMAKVVYFMKRPGKERDDKVALDPLKAQDGALFFGTIGQPLQSLEAMLRTLYSPMLASDSRHVWGASSDEQEALDKSKSSKGIVGETNKQQLAVLQELSSWCLTDLKTKMNRRKIETLVTIHVHQRDVFADLARIFKERKQLDSGDFEWLKQARFYWRNDARDLHGNAACVVSICDIDFQYNFEYLGCKERLVITPLTDRC